MATVGKLAGVAAISVLLYGTSLFTRERADPSWSSGAGRSLATKPDPTPTPAPAPELRAASQDGALGPVRSASIVDPDNTGTVPGAAEHVSVEAARPGDDRLAITNNPRPRPAAKLAQRLQRDAKLAHSFTRRRVMRLVHISPALA